MICADVFSKIYRNNLWADPESLSGRGSTLARTGVIRAELPRLLHDAGAKTLLDAACGDFNWMRHCDLGSVQYIGVDIVPELIAQNREKFECQRRRFAILDITSTQVPEADIILCRDCFVHLSFKDIHSALDNFKKSKASFLLATTHTSVSMNEDIPTGAWRSVNLQAWPFNLPHPDRLIVEDPDLGKCLGLWRIQNL